MDEDELIEFVRDETSVEEIDMDYEFDAARFHDFTRAETESEAGDTERWFDFAGNYPTSPFIMKLKWREGFRFGVANTFDNSKAFDDVNANNTRGLNDDHNTQELSQAKSKSRVTRSSTLMKPTASHLAKQNPLVHSIRLQKKIGSADEMSQNSSVTDDLATSKRQKLEAGYSSKVAHMKHKAILSHKVPKTVHQENVVPKRTIPREPHLETARRAEQRRYRVVGEFDGQAKANAYKGCVNKKIVRPPCSQITLWNKQRASVFRETNKLDFCSPSQNKNIERKSSSLSQSSNSATSLRRDKFEAINYVEALSSNRKKLPNHGKFCISRSIRRSITATRVVPTVKMVQDEPPINLFSKLCLASEALKDTIPPQKEIKGTRLKSLRRQDALENLKH